MLEDNVLYGFLEKLARDAMKQIETEGNLSQQNVLPFLIKNQYQKIERIESEFVTKREFQELQGYVEIEFGRVNAKIDDLRHEVFTEMNKRFKEVDEKFKTIYWMIGILFSLQLATFAILVTLILRIPVSQQTGASLSLEQIYSIKARFSSSKS